MEACPNRRPGGPRTRARDLIGARLVLGFVASALHGCATDPTPVATDAGASDYAVDEATPPDGPVFEAAVPFNCATTVPRVTPIQPEPPDTSCLFDVSPPLPADAWVNGVTVDGVDLPGPEYTLIGRDVLELTGQACTEYRAGEIADIRLILACPA